MSTMPKFNFSNASVKTEEELQSSLESLGGQSKYFRPGQHEVTIDSVVYQGNASDPTWGKFLLTLKGTGTKEITAQVMVPFQDIEYRTSTGKTTKYMYLKFVGFMKALGYDVKIENLGELLPTVFTNPERTLVGRNIGIEVGYNGNHIAYRGKDEIGNKLYNIVFKDGSVLCDASKKPMVFNDWEAAARHAEANQTAISKYVEVLSYRTPLNPNTVDASW